MNQDLLKLLYFISGVVYKKNKLYEIKILILIADLSRYIKILFHSDLIYNIRYEVNY